MRKVVLLATMVAALSVFLAACGGDEEPTPTSAPPTPPPASAATAVPQQTPIPTEAAPMSDEEGKRVFESGSAPPCTACHAIEGISAAAIGPELTHMGTVAATRKAGMSAEDYIRESLENPGAFVVDGFQPIMPPNIRDTITDEGLEALVAYLLAQK